MRTTRSKKSKSNSTEKDKPEVSSQEKETEVAPASDDIEKKPETESSKEVCPACSNDGNADDLPVPAEDWVRCDACKTWYHWRCAGNGQELEVVDKWCAYTQPGCSCGLTRCRFCSSCMSVDPKRVITLKPPARKSSRKKFQHDYANLHAEGSSPPRLQTDTEEWLNTLEKRATSGDPFPRMKGAELTLDWLANNENAMTEPILVEQPEGLGMEMPEPGLTVADIADIVGVDTPVEVMGMHPAILVYTLFTLSKTWQHRQIPRDIRCPSGLNIITPSNPNETKSAT